MARRTRSPWLAWCLAPLLLISASACGSGSSGHEDGRVTLTIAAAADHQSAFTEIGSAFTDETGYAVEFNFGSSGQLASQIERGAPFDVFAAASVDFIDDLIASGDIYADSKQLYAVGRIVLVSNAQIDVPVQTLDDLLDPRIGKVAIANPEHAPYGVAARDALQRTGVWDQIQSKIVFGDNVRHTLQLVQLGEAEAGIVALAIADVPEVTYTLVDASLHEPIVQAIGVTVASDHEAEARVFVAFVMGDAGQAILQRYGFERPQPSTP